jgi:MSHA pilin protein MshD
MSNTKGFSLIEIIVFIVVFVIGVMGLMILFYNIMGKTSDPTIRLKGIQTAQAVMDKILARKWDELTPNGGGIISVSNSTIQREEMNFNDFDDVDDYNDLDCLAGSSNCFDIKGNFRIKVKVEYGRLNGTNMEKNGLNKTNYKIIEVKVNSESINETYKILAVKGNF